MDNKTIINGTEFTLDDNDMGNAKALAEIIWTSKGPVFSKALEIHAKRMSGLKGLHDTLFNGEST